MIGVMALKFKKIISFVLLILFVAAVYFLPSLFLNSNQNIDDNVTEKPVRAKVLKITSVEKTEDTLSDGQAYIYIQHMDVKLLNGEHKGEIMSAENIISDMMAYKLIVEEGDEVLALLGQDENGEANLYIYEIARDKYFFILIILFVIALIVFGGMKGLKSVITLILTVIIIIKIMFPLILRGCNPLIIAIGACVLITFVTLLILNGFNKKTFNAIMGTIGGVLIAGTAAYTIGSLSKITGLGEHEAQMLTSVPQNFNFDYRGILFAGIIMGALGAVMDIGMSIASSMNEIEAAKPDIKTKDLIKSGMNVGRDIMGTMSNTLILAYAGSSIHLLLLFLVNNVNLIDVINMDMIASEIIRALSGSIGLVCTIPITALISGTLGRRKI